MALLETYQEARRSETVTRLRRVLALRAMAASGMSQREIASALGVSQPAISQQLKVRLDDVHPETLLAAAAPVLKQLAGQQGFTRLAVFGSVARGDARRDSDIDLLVEVPRGTTLSGLGRFKTVVEQVLGREVDLVTYGGLKPRVDDDIRRDAVLL